MKMKLYVCITKEGKGVQKKMTVIALYNEFFFWNKLLYSASLKKTSNNTPPKTQPSPELKRKIREKEHLLSLNVETHSYTNTH